MFKNPMIIRSIVVLGVLVILAVFVLPVIFTEGPLAWAGPNIFGVGDGPVPIENEVVMSPGEQITAFTPAGNITITAGKGLKRSYTWDGATRSVEMHPRDKDEKCDMQREMGYKMGEEDEICNMGIYFPGAGEHWLPNHGITRGVLSEAQIHFKSEKEALKWLSKTPGFMPRIYRNDGLTVWCLKTPGRKQLSVDVDQIYINGKKPKNLAGSEDNKILVSSGK